MIEFNFNEYILYQEYNHKFDDKEAIIILVNGMAKPLIMVTEYAVGFSLKMMNYL